MEKEISPFQFSQDGLLYAKELARTAKEHLENSEHLKTAFAICDFVCGQQSLDGAIGSIWDSSFTMKSQQGFDGAYLIKPLGKAFELSGQHSYHVGAVRAFSYYFRKMMNNGGADEKSVFEIIRSAILLYKYTGFEKYLDMADEAVDYITHTDKERSVQND